MANCGKIEEVEERKEFYISQKDILRISTWNLTDEKDRGQNKVLLHVYPTIWIIYPLSNIHAYVKYI